MGVELSNGHRYRPDARGSIDVQDPEDQRTIASYLGAPFIGFSGATTGEKSCRCGFTCWPWQTQCPRCGREV